MVCCALWGPYVILAQARASQASGLVAIRAALATLCLVPRRLVGPPTLKRVCALCDGCWQQLCQRARDHALSGHFRGRRATFVARAGTCGNPIVVGGGLSCLCAHRVATLSLFKLSKRLRSRRLLLSPSCVRSVGLLAVLVRAERPSADHMSLWRRTLAQFGVLVGALWRGPSLVVVRPLLRDAC